MTSKKQQTSLLQFFQRPSAKSLRESPVTSGRKVNIATIAPELKPELVIDEDIIVDFNAFHGNIDFDQTAPEESAYSLHEYAPNKLRDTEPFSEDLISAGQDVSYHTASQSSAGRNSSPSHPHPPSDPSIPVRIGMEPSQNAKSSLLDMDNLSPFSRKLMERREILLNLTTATKRQTPSPISNVPDQIRVFDTNNSVLYIDEDDNCCGQDFEFNLDDKFVSPSKDNDGSESGGGRRKSARLNSGLTPVQKHVAFRQRGLIINSDSDDDFPPEITFGSSRSKRNSPDRMSEDAVLNVPKKTKIIDGFDIDSLLNEKDHKRSVGADLETLGRILSENCEPDAAEAFTTEISAEEIELAAVICEKDCEIENFDIFEKTKQPKLLQNLLKGSLDIDVFEKLNNDQILRRRLKRIKPGPISEWFYQMLWGEDQLFQSMAMDVLRTFYGQHRLVFNDFCKILVDYCGFLKFDDIKSLFDKRLMVKENKLEINDRFENSRLMGIVFLFDLISHLQLENDKACGWIALLLRIMIVPGLDPIINKLHSSLEHIIEKFEDIIGVSFFIRKASVEAKTKIILCLPSSTSKSRSLVQELSWSVLENCLIDPMDRSIKSLSASMNDGKTFRINQETDYDLLYLNFVCCWRILITLSPQKFTEQKNSLLRLAQSVHYISGRILDPKGAFQERTRVKDLALMMESFIRGLIDCSQSDEIYQKKITDFLSLQNTT